MTQRTASSGRKLALLALGGFLLFAVSASSADTFTVTLVSQTETTITLGWTPQPGYGYLFSADGQLVSRTNDPNRSTVRFSKQYTSFDIDVITKGANGHYPPVTPPPPKNQCEDGIDNDGDGKIDYPADPGCSSATDNDETDPVIPPPSGAQVKMATNGNDSTCARNGSPCLTLNRAYQVAQPGDTVEIAAGTYTQSTTINADPSKTSQTDVLFRPAAGATVTLVEQVIIRGAHMTFDGSAGMFRWQQNFKFDAPSGTDVTLAHIDARGGQANIFGGASYVTLTDVDMGSHCSSYSDAIIVWEVDHIVIQDSTIGDICVLGDSHPDCVSLATVHDVVFQRNRVWKCAVQGFYPANDGAGRNARILVENNWFGDMGSGTSANIGDSDGVNFRYNSFAVGVPGYYFGGNSTGWVTVANAMPFWACETDTTYSYNVMAGGTCSSTDFNGNPGFVKNTGDDFDLHLATNTSPACSRGKPGAPATVTVNSHNDFTAAWYTSQGDFPATDYDRQPRVSRPDAGSDERPDC